MGQSRASDSAVPHLSSRITDNVELLMQASLAASSKVQYERSWSKLVGFFQSLGCVPTLPVSVAMMLLFVAHLHNAGYAPSSIISAISAISYFHKVNGLHDTAKN